MNIAVYCAASQSNCPAFDKKTEELGKWMVKTQPHARLWWWQYWINGCSSDCRDEGRWRLIGVMPQFFVDREIAKQDITKLHIVDTMSQRKNRMIALSEVYIAFLVVLVPLKKRRGRFLGTCRPNQWHLYFL